jgi:hypothetical protein
MPGRASWRESRGGIGPFSDAWRRAYPDRREKNFGRGDRETDVPFDAMPQKPRPHRVQVKLDVDEYEALATRATKLGVSRSSIVRDALRNASTRPAREPTHDEALELLATVARAGNVAAMIALERALRLGSAAAPEPVGLAVEEVDELAALRSLHARIEAEHRR